MAGETDQPRIHIDSDWKTEAAREKERLAKEEARERKDRAPAGEAEPSFLELVNLLAMQAIVALGGYQGPGGERIPANPMAAKYQIDLLDVLQKKTQGNLSEEERRTLEAVLYELRMNYVRLVTPPAPGKQSQA
jgi:hypothetical protein